METDMKILSTLTLVLIIVGGLNWGLVGLAKFDLVATIFGVGSALSNIVYTLVGISALFQALRLATPAPKLNTVTSR
jgi:uncharacterized membrane protein YuzA (DUF378 family)